MCSIQAVSAAWRCGCFWAPGRLLPPPHLGVHPHRSSSGPYCLSPVQSTPAIVPRGCRSAHTHSPFLSSAGFWLVWNLKDLRTCPTVSRQGVISCRPPPSAGREGSSVFEASLCTRKGSLFHPDPGFHSFICQGKQNWSRKEAAKKRRRERRKVGAEKDKVEGKARIKTLNRGCHGKRKNVSQCKGLFFQKKTTAGCKMNLLLLDYLTLSSIQGSHPD